MISCGEGNNYGHPNAETLNNLRTTDVKLFRTDEQGSVVATSDGTNIGRNCTPTDSWQVGESTEIAKSQENTTEESETETLGSEESISEEEIEAEIEAIVATAFDYLINMNSKKFYFVSCRSGQNISKTNRLFFTEIREDIINNGYSPCGNCNP